MRTLAAAFRESSDGVDHGVEPGDEGRSSHQLLRVGLIGTAPSTTWSVFCPLGSDVIWCGDDSRPVEETRSRAWRIP
jgi:hypothetical protein